MFLTLGTLSDEKRGTKSARAGFTIIELMIAIVILGIIMAAVVGPFFGYLERGKKHDAKSTIKTFKNAILMYNADVQQYPQTLRDLIKKPLDEAIAKKWQGPYIDRKEVPNDPWGNKYVYHPTPEGENPYELLSYGSSKGKATPKSDWISVWDE